MTWANWLSDKMTETQKYFIELLSSHLNNSPPPPNSSADWMGVFKLGELHNITAILCVQIKKLPFEQQPEKKIMSLFNQALGMTLQRYNTKTQAIEYLNEILDENKIRRLFLKGAAIRQLFPVGELRTSGDTDLVVDAKSLDKAADLLVDRGFKLSQRTDVQNVVFYNDEEFEIKNYIDCLNSSLEEYFSDSFDMNKCEAIGDFIYYLKPVYHLIYIISHFLRHLTEGGVGIRQLMDIDVLLRNSDIDIDELINICAKLSIEKSAKALIALSKAYFNTPVECDYTIDEELKDSLGKVILNGGVFGFAISNPGTVRQIEIASKSENSSFALKIKSLLRLIFPEKAYLYRYYPYCAKHRILLPLAFFNRLSDAVFKRGKTNIRSVKTILTDDKTALKISDIMNELEIKKDI